MSNSFQKFMENEKNFIITEEDLDDALVIDGFYFQRKPYRDRKNFQPGTEGYELPASKYAGADQMYIPLKFKSPTPIVPANLETIKETQNEPCTSSFLSTPSCSFHTVAAQDKLTESEMVSMEQTQNEEPDESMKDQKSINKSLRPISNDEPAKKIRKIKD